MIPFLVVLPDGRRGEADIDPTYSIKDIKKSILKSAEFDNENEYILAIYPRNESESIFDIYKKGGTIKVEKMFKLKIEGEV